ncbi:hypothetical protein [Georgenia sp. SYP-B2076]|uniref:hypothetical protein n=1 Tax=Georgenia sp. SYP-B2076 TaxID=2495881 RepID=UPI0013DEEE42|nr:hypothetical protein [Georgenia sp. SYP-B2076]
MDGGVGGIILWLVTLFAVYWSVRAAVKDGILDAAHARDKEITKTPPPGAVDTSA